MNEKSLKQTIDYNYYWLNLLLALGLLIFLSLVDFGIYLLNDSILILIIGLSFVGVVFLPFIIYYIFRIRMIFKDKDKYIYVKTKLETARTGFFNRLYFDFKIIDKNNRVILLSTKSLFSTSLFNVGIPNFEDYNSKECLIGYNKVTNEVVVFKKN